MKSTNDRQILGLAFSFFLIFVTALASQVSAEEYYTYQDTSGKLVISNKKPPAGSKILKTQEFPAEPAEAETSKAANPPAAGKNDKRPEKSKP